MNVYVRNHDGSPLMPCRPAKARKLLRAGRAKVAEGRLAFKRVKGHPPSALPKDCRLLERGKTIIWEKVA